jgi:hypothetical protein
MRQTVNLPLNERERDALRSYIKARVKAWRVYDDAHDEAREAYRRARRAVQADGGEAWRIYDETRDEAWAACEKVCHEALKAYAANPAGNPLALWIARRDDHRSQRREILSLLVDGADFAELQKHAAASWWCEDWDEAVVAALKRFDVRTRAEGDA